MSAKRTRKEPTDDFGVGGINITAEPCGTLASDCLLHGEHHQFDTDCWDHFMAYYDRARHIFPRARHAELIARYSLAYEAKVLREMIHG